jgi:hypothetical protein
LLSPLSPLTSVASKTKAPARHRHLWIALTRIAQMTTTAYSPGSFNPSLTTRFTVHSFFPDSSRVRSSSQRSIPCSRMNRATGASSSIPIANATMNKTTQVNGFRSNFPKRVSI